MRTGEQRDAASADAEPQARTDAHFSRVADYWRDVYAQGGLGGLVYRERLDTVLAWVDAMGLPPGAEVLEIGCGAGHATVELARRGLAVASTDSSPEMVARAAERIAAAGLDDVVRLGTADAHALAYPDRRFALVVALGVLPWLHTPERALSELARVLAPGGHAIVTADNRLRLNALVEPLQNPLVTPVRQVRRAVLGGRRPSGGPAWRMDSPRRVDRMLRAAGLEPQRRATLGYGPFTFLLRPVLPDRAGLRLHLRLRGLAARHPRTIRRAGWHYAVCAERIG